MALPLKERLFSRDRRWRTATVIATFIALIGLWAAVTYTRIVDPLFLPTPTDVWHAFVDANTWHVVSEGSNREVLGEQGYFLWQHLQASLHRIIVGVGAAIVVGVIVGVILGTFRPIAVSLEPYLNFLRALPPLGYIGLLIVWFGIGDTSKYWLLFLAAFPPIAISTLTGIRGVLKNHVNASYTLGASKLYTIFHVILPSSLPDIIQGVRLAVGFAWTTVVAAELNNGIPGIGGLAYLSGTQLDTPLVIACIITIGITAVLLDLIIVKIGDLLVPWKGQA